MQQLGLSGFASTLPQEFISQHFMDFWTPKLGTAVPPRSVGYWGAFPLPVPRGPTFGKPPAAEEGSPTLQPQAEGAPGADGIASGASDERQAVGGAGMGRVLDDVAKKMQQQRLTPRTAAAAAAGGSRGSSPRAAAGAAASSSPTAAGGSVKAAVAAAMAAGFVGSPSSPSAAAAPRAGGGFSGSLAGRHGASSSPEASPKGLVITNQKSAPIALGASPQLAVLAKSAGAAVGGNKAAGASTSSPAAAAETAAAAAAAAAAALDARLQAQGLAPKAAGGRISPRQPSSQQLLEVFKPGSPILVSSHRMGAAAAASSAAGQVTTKSSSPRLQGVQQQQQQLAGSFVGPLLQPTGGLAAAAESAALQRKQEQQEQQAADNGSSNEPMPEHSSPAQPPAVVQPPHLTTPSPGQLPAGVECVVATGKGGAQQLVFHAGDVLGQGAP